MASESVRHVDKDKSFEKEKKIVIVTLWTTLAEMETVKKCEYIFA